MLVSNVPQTWGTFDRKSTLYKIMFFFKNVLKNTLQIFQFLSEGRRFHVLA